jgi:hypothetical protein
MGNQRLEHRRSQVNATPLIALKTTGVETQRQHAGIGITQSFNASITTKGVEMVATPNIDVVKRGVLIGSTTKLGSESNAVPTRRNMN